jgi:hypothetical protein
MKPKKFSIGQEVTLIAKPKCLYRMKDLSRINVPCPKFGKVYKIVEIYAGTYDDEWYLVFSEFNHSFAQWGFAPVISDKSLCLALEEINEKEIA